MYIIAQTSLAVNIIIKNQPALLWKIRVF